MHYFGRGIHDPSKNLSQISKEFGSIQILMVFAGQCTKITLEYVFDYLNVIYLFFLFFHSSLQNSNYKNREFYAGSAVMYHGEVKNKNELVERFRNGDVQIFAATQIGMVGLNMVTPQNVVKEGTILFFKVTVLKILKENGLDSSVPLERISILRHTNKPLGECIGFDFPARK